MNNDNSRPQMLSKEVYISKFVLNFDFYKEDREDYNRVFVIRVLTCAAYT